MWTEFQCNQGNRIDLCNYSGTMSSSRQGTGNCQPWFEIDIVLSNLFYFLPAKEILACHSVSRTWAKLLNTSDDSLQYWKWKMLLKHTWPHFYVGPKGLYSGKTLRECMNCDDYLRIKYCQNYGVGFQPRVQIWKIQ